MNRILEAAVEIYEDLTTLTGYDDCVVGVIHRFGAPPTLCYDLNKVLKKLCKEGMTPEEAQEWWDFNMVGAYVGEQTPVYLERL